MLQQTAQYNQKKSSREMVAFVKVIHCLVILVVINGLLSYAYSRIGVSMASGGCNAALAQRVGRNPPLMVAEWRKLKLRGAKLGVDGNMKRLEKATANLKTIREEESAKKNAVLRMRSKNRILRQREVAVATNDYDRGPRHHPPQNN